MIRNLRSLVRTVIAFVLVLSFIFTPLTGVTGELTVIAAEQYVRVTINGQYVTFSDQQPVIRDGRTLVPARGVFEHMGYGIEWFGDVQMVKLSKDVDVIWLQIDYPQFQFNDDMIDLDVPAQIISSRTMLPLRAIVEILGSEVEWDEANYTAHIYWDGTIPESSQMPEPVLTTGKSYNDMTKEEQDAHIAAISASGVTTPEAPYGFLKNGYPRFWISDEDFYRVPYMSSQEPYYTEKVDLPMVDLVEFKVPYYHAIRRSLGTSTDELNRLGVEQFMEKYYSAYVKQFSGGVLPRNITVIPRSQLTLDEARCEPVIAEALIEGIPRVFVEETRLQNWYNGLSAHKDSERLLEEFNRLLDSLESDIPRYLLDLSIGYLVCLDITDYEGLRSYLIEDAAHRREHIFYSTYDAVAESLYGKTTTEIKPLSACSGISSISISGNYSSGNYSVSLETPNGTVQGTGVCIESNAATHSNTAPEGSQCSDYAMDPNLTAAALFLTSSAEGGVRDADGNLTNGDGVILAYADGSLTENGYYMLEAIAQGTDSGAVSRFMASLGAVDGVLEPPTKILPSHDASTLLPKTINTTVIPGPGIPENAFIPGGQVTLPSMDGTGGYVTYNNKQEAINAVNTRNENLNSRDGGTTTTSVPWGDANPGAWGVEPMSSDCSTTVQTTSAETVCPDSCVQEIITKFYEGAYFLIFEPGESCSEVVTTEAPEPQTFTTNSKTQTVLVSVVGSTTESVTESSSCQGFEVPHLTQAEETQVDIPSNPECAPCDMLEVILEATVGGACPSEDDCSGSDCSTTCSLPACAPIPCPPPPPPPACPSPDPAPSPVIQNCGESGEVNRIEREYRWYNVPLAYGEFKNDMPFNNLGETSSSTSSVIMQSRLGISPGEVVPFSHDRITETFEAMYGMPETEMGYLNAGATDVVMDVTAKHVVVTYAYVSTNTVTECGGYSCTLSEKPWPQTVDECSGVATCSYQECREVSCDDGDDCTTTECESKTKSGPASNPTVRDCGPQYDMNYTGGFEGCVTHQFCTRSEVTYEYFEIVDVTVHVPEKVVSCNPALYQSGLGPVDENGCVEIAYDIPVEVQMNIVPKGHGANYGTADGRDNHDFGTTELEQVGKNEINWSGQDCADSSYDVEVPIVESYPYYHLSLFDSPGNLIYLRPEGWLPLAEGQGALLHHYAYHRYSLEIPIVSKHQTEFWAVMSPWAPHGPTPCGMGCSGSGVFWYVIEPLGYADVIVDTETQHVAQVDCESGQMTTGSNANATDKDQVSKLQEGYLSEHNSQFGEIHAQSDSLTIYVGSGSDRQVYEFIPSDLITRAGGDASEIGVAGQGIISAAAMGQMFNPISERWSLKKHVPTSGYTGSFLKTPERNTGTMSFSGKTQIGPYIWLKTGIPIVPRLPNGVYSFEPYANYNYVQYKKIDHGYSQVTQSREIYSDNSGWRDGSASNLSHIPESVTNPAKHKGSQYNHILMEYTAWQYTGNREPSHHVNGPNGPSSYYSVNPVIIHNPISAVAWLHDTNETILKDQRIKSLDEEPDGDVVPHPRSTDSASPARLYVDFDFKISIPNHGFFQQFEMYTGGTARGDSRESQMWSLNKDPRGGDRGVENLVMTTYFTGPGYVGVQEPSVLPRSLTYPASLLPTLGVGGTVDLWNVDAPYLLSIESPPKEQGLDRGHSDTGWDVSKWINAKFVQFPFDVYYYGTYDPDSGSPTENPFSAGWGGNQYPGGDPAGFYRAGAWIKIFDHGGNIVVGSDYTDNATKNPEVFNFRVASHVRDMADAEIFVLNEAINSPYRHLDTQSRAQIQWSESSSWTTNMTRFGLYTNGQPNNMNALSNPSMQRLANLAATSGDVNHHNVRQSSMHAARNVLYADVIGRIGNVVVDDTADSRWSSIFWDTSGGKINVNSAVSRGVAVYYNMFDSVQPWIDTTGLINGSKYPWDSSNPAPAGGFINRFSTLSAWHNFQETLGHGLNYTLPLMTNPIPQYSGQTVKLGYEVQASVQTLGDYDREGAEMWVYPRYSLIGNYSTSNDPDERFHLYATDQWSAGQPIKEYWDSYLQFGRHFQTSGSTWAGASNNGTRHLGLDDGTWSPQLEHKFYHSLADPRAKINPMEKYTVSYQDAVKKGSNTTEYLGDPSFIAIPQTLRTWHGGGASVLGGAAVTKGRSGQSNDWWMVQSSPDVSSGGDLFSKTFAEAGSTPEQYWQVDDIKYAALANAQRWHFRHSLPRTTQVIFESQLPNNRFEGRTKDQYIGVGFVFRTVGKNELWDLSTYTNSTAANEPYIYPDPDTELGWEAGNDPGDPVWSRGTKDWFRLRSRRPWYPSVTPQTNEPPVFEPFTPIIILDYSNPSQTDSTTIGTH